MKQHFACVALGSLFMAQEVASKMIHYDLEQVPVERVERSNNI